MKLEYIDLDGIKWVQTWVSIGPGVMQLVWVKANQKTRKEEKKGKAS